MPSSTIENYAKNIYLLSQQLGREQVPMGEVARALGVVPGTATTMIKSLARHGYAEYEPRAGVALSAEGRTLALQVLRRHRLIETFLVEKLGMDWGEIHEEAEALEHAVSERMLERLDAFLGRPSYDPHGDPIPDASGRMQTRQLRPLSECQAGTQTRIGRILDQEEAFLRFVQEHGLTPGSLIAVRRFNASAQCLEVEVLDDAVLVQSSANSSGGSSDGERAAGHVGGSSDGDMPRSAKMPTAAAVAVVSIGQQAAAKILVE